MKKRTEKKKFPIILNPELQRVAKSFVPVFGHPFDLQIVKRMGEIERRLSEFDNEPFREAERTGNTKALTPTMRQIQVEEKYLIEAINNRNFDF